MLNVAQAAFAGACFWGFSDIHESLFGSIAPKQVDNWL